MGKPTTDNNNITLLLHCLHVTDKHFLVHGKLHIFTSFLLFKDNLHSTIILQTNTFNNEGELRRIESRCLLFAKWQWVQMHESIYGKTLNTLAWVVSEVFTNVIRQSLQEFSVSQYFFFRKYDRAGVVGCHQNTLKSSGSNASSHSSLGRINEITINQRNWQKHITALNLLWKNI